jgi:hypothetical protein
MSYYERYEGGEHVAVWDELTRLGGAVRDPALFGDAAAVAQATMARVATNIDRLIERLTEEGFEFGVYPDGTEVPVRDPARAKPNAALCADVDALEFLAGPIPLSLRKFWEVVGTVSLIGRGREGWPLYSDPLFVESPGYAVSQFRQLTEEEAGELLDPFFCCLAPDVFHKDNISGGSEYGIALPNAGIDALFRNEWREIGFVPYLRVAILEWGGFPGLSPANPQDRWRQKHPDVAPPAWLGVLTKDLMAF